jgi:hypothetical protein
VRIAGGLPQKTGILVCKRHWKRYWRRRQRAIQWGSAPKASAARYRSLGSLPQLRAALTAAGHPASHFTVAKLLRQAGYSPKANLRRAEARHCAMPRDAQFRHSAEQREQFQTTGDPVISVDTKKN